MFKLVEVVYDYIIDTLIWTLYYLVLYMLEIFILCIYRTLKYYIIIYVIDYNEIVSYVICADIL